MNEPMIAFESGRGEVPVRRFAIPTGEKPVLAAPVGRHGSAAAAPLDATVLRVGSA